jgi:hypothetical protein
MSEVGLSVGDRDASSPVREMVVGASAEGDESSQAGRKTRPRARQASRTVERISHLMDQATATKSVVHAGLHALSKL